MPRTTHETLLISSIINSGDAHAARSYGVIPGHFNGYREHYEWLMSYYEAYGHCPTLTQLETAFPGFPHADDQFEARWPAHEVKRAFAARDLMQRTVKITQELSRGNVEAAYGQLEGARLEGVTERPANVLVDPAFLDDYDDDSEKRIPMPWNTLQGITNGMGPGELWYFAARQGQGKTSMLLDMGVSAAFAGLNVMVYSLEMTKRQVQVRTHVSAGHRLGFKVDQSAMLHRRFDPLKYKELLNTIDEKVPGVLHIHDTSMGRVTPAAILSRASDYDVLIVDYVGLMYNDEKQPAIRDYRVMAEISNQLKEIALAKKTRILGAAQINREGDTAGWRPPKLKHLAQSDHLGNDGDVVLMMKRYGKGAAVICAEKNRHGDSERLFFTKYDPNHGNYTEIDRDTADEIREEDEFNE